MEDKKKKEGERKEHAQREMPRKTNRVESPPGTEHAAYRPVFRETLKGGHIPSRPITIADLEKVPVEGPEQNVENISIPSVHSNERVLGIAIFLAVPCIIFAVISLAAIYSWYLTGYPGPTLLSVLFGPYIFPEFELVIWSFLSVLFLFLAIGRFRRIRMMRYLERKKGKGNASH